MSWFLDAFSIICLNMHVYVQMLVYVCVNWTVVCTLPPEDLHNQSVITLVLCQQFLNL